MTKKSKGVERFCLQYLAEYGIFKCIKNIGSKGIGALHHVGELPKGGSLKKSARPLVINSHGSCSKFAHRYEVSSRQHSGSCGEDAIIRIEDKKLLLRVILTKKENVCDFLLSNLFSEEDRRDE